MFKTMEIIHTPKQFSFVDELGYNAAGLSREVYTVFWNTFLASCVDGETVRIPAINSHYGFEEWHAIARILVKVYIDARVFPLQLAPAFVLAHMFGEESNSLETLLDSYFLYISKYDRAVMHAALNGTLSEDEMDSFPDIMDMRKFVAYPQENKFK